MGGERPRANDAQANPYAPPSTDLGRDRSSALRLSVWLGWLEIVVGVALAIGGCTIGATDDSSMGGIIAVYAFFVGVLFAIVPGTVLLLVRHPLRWVGQLLPIAFVTLYAAAHIALSSR